MPPVINHFQVQLLQQLLRIRSLELQNEKLRLKIMEMEHEEAKRVVQKGQRRKQKAELREQARVEWEQKHGEDDEELQERLRNLRK